MKLFLLIITFASFALQAQDFLDRLEEKKRWVDFSWDKIDEASYYEIKLYKQDQDGKSYLYKEYQKKDTEWAEELGPGDYSLKMRTVDTRGVPTKWGEPIIFEVKLPDPALIYPYENDEILAYELDQEEIQFNWKEVAKSSAYALQIWSADEQFRKIIICENNSHRIELKTGKNYLWKITPLANKKSPVPPANEGRAFTLIGGRLAPPIPSVKMKNGQFLIEWMRGQRDLSYTLEILGQNRSGQWTNLKTIKDLEGTSIRFNPIAKFNTYRLALKSKCKDFQDSPYTFLEFSAKAQKISDQRLRIQRPEDITSDRNFFYQIGSQIYRLNYQGTTAETDSQVKSNFNGLSIYGEAYYQQYYNYYRHRLYVDIQSLKNFEGSIVLGEFNIASGRTFSMGQHQFEAYLGLFAKRDLYLIGNQLSNSLELETIGTMGPVVEAHYRYQVNRRHSFGGNIRLKNHLLTIYTPNQEEIEQSFSYGLELNYHYRLSHHSQIIFNAGVFANNLQYRATSKNDSSLAASGEKNDAQSLGQWFGLRYQGLF